MAENPNQLQQHYYQLSGHPDQPAGLGSFIWVRFRGHRHRPLLTSPGGDDWKTDAGCLINGWEC